MELKPGVAMETTKLSQSSRFKKNKTEEAQSKPALASNKAAPVAVQKDNGNPHSAKGKPKPKSTTPSGVSGSSSWPGTASQHTVKDVKSFVSRPTGKTVTTTSKATSGAASKRPVGVASTSTTAKNQTKVPDKRLVGSTRAMSHPAATAINDTKPSTVNEAHKKRLTTLTVNGARHKTPATTGKMASSIAQARTISATTKKNTSLATSPAPSGTTTPKHATVKTSLSRAATAPSTGKMAATQPKKDVSRQPPAPLVKKPTPIAVSPSTKIHDTSKCLAALRLNTASKGSTPMKRVDAKELQSKHQQLGKLTPTKKPTTTIQFPLVNKLSLNQPLTDYSTIRATNIKTKCGTKPTKTAPRFTITKKTEVSKTNKPSTEVYMATVVTATPPQAVQVPEKLAEAAMILAQESSLVSSAAENISTLGSAPNTTKEMEKLEVTPDNEVTQFPPQSPVGTNLPQTCLKHKLENIAPHSAKQEQVSNPAKLALQSMALPPELTEYNVVKDQTPSKSTVLLAAANGTQQVVPLVNLNEEEDEERDGSQLVSVSEMSGTTQLTEDSHPGSVGTIGGSAWRALVYELDSEEISVSQQGASELSAPGVLEGTESMDDLGDGSLKGAMDMEGASAGSPDFEKVSYIQGNDFEGEDDSDKVCDMDVGSERMDEPCIARHDNDLDEDDDDVEMASEGVTESGLESYGNGDEDDFAEDERLDNLNRVAQPPLPPVLPSAPAAQWDQPNPFADPCEEPLQVFKAAGPLTAQNRQEDPEILLKTQVCLEQVLPKQEESKKEQAQASVQTHAAASFCVPGTSVSHTLSSEMSILKDQSCNQDSKLPSEVTQAQLLFSACDAYCQGLGFHFGQGDEDAVEAEKECLPADELLGGSATAPTSNLSLTTQTEDEARDTEGEAQLEHFLETLEVNSINFEMQLPAQHCPSTLVEGNEPEVESGVGEESTPSSAALLVSYSFGTMTMASNSNAQPTGESCVKSPSFILLEEHPQEVKQPHTEQCPTDQLYGGDSANHVIEKTQASEEVLDPTLALNNMPQTEEIPDDIEPLYHSAICENTEKPFAGFSAVSHPHCQSAHPRIYNDIVKPISIAITLPKLACADVQPRNPRQQPLSSQLLRLEQHQKQLPDLQQHKEPKSKPQKEAVQEKKKRVKEEERKEKEHAEEEIKGNKEEKKKKHTEMIKQDEIQNWELEVKHRRDLELQMQQQELKEQQKIIQRQQELHHPKGQTALLSSPSGLCTIYETLECSDGEADGEDLLDPKGDTKNEELNKNASQRLRDRTKGLWPSDDAHQQSSIVNILLPYSDSTMVSSNIVTNQDGSSFQPAQFPERPPALDLDWGKKVDMVQQLINQTLLLNADCCSSLLLLPSGTGGKLSPLESSLWPSLLPPLAPPSATVTSVSSFSTEDTGSSTQGEWTVVELETHH
ncbi:unnamed protein product [Menidia menidia]|uniref:(Atlantic silverside) hypothetical protein n=1 Tax=Menidia menidia TaxID=238744 RepID=A0A8S4BBN1_9TELE|nr:unnamed protein product [Menidia menidia]